MVRSVCVVRFSILSVDGISIKSRPSSSSLNSIASRGSSVVVLRIVLSVVIIKSNPFMFSANNILVHLNHWSSPWQTKHWNFLQASTLRVC